MQKPSTKTRIETIQQGFLLHVPFLLRCKSSLQKQGLKLCNCQIRISVFYRKWLQKRSTKTRIETSGNWSEHLLLLHCCKSGLQKQGLKRLSSPISITLLFCNRCKSRLQKQGLKHNRTSISTLIFSQLQKQSTKTRIETILYIE